MASAKHNPQEILSREMMKAVTNGDVQKVIDITENYGLSHCDEWLDGCALLHEALRIDKPDVARVLIKAGAQVTNSEKKISIFHEAVAKISPCYVPIVELLLAKGGSVNARNQWGNSPLHCVKTLGMAWSLFNFHADTPPNVNATNNEGLTPLHLAVRSKNYDLAQFLIHKGADVNLCATGGEKGTALHIACKRAAPDIVKLLLKYGADVEATDEEGKTPIYLAILYADRDAAVIVRSLLDKGAVLEPTPGLLFGALSQRCPELVVALIKHGCAVDERVGGQTCLHYMVSPFHYTGAPADGANALQIVFHLLANGADVCAKTEEDGATALSRAVQYELFEVVPILLDYGAEYQIPPSGDTLLHLCARASREVSAHTFKALLKRLADISARTNAFGETPLHLAAESNSDDLIKALLSFWPDVGIDARDKDGSTALAKAAAGLCHKSVRTLLSYGADVNIPNNKGLTPLQIVEEYRATRSRSISKVLPVSMDLRRHITKLNCADLPVSEDNLSACGPTSYLGEVFYDPDDYTRGTLHDPYYVKRCNDEVNRMKNERIGRSRVSYYDILSSSCQQVAIYTKNTAVSSVMESEESGIHKFREYGRWIDVRYRRAKRRVQLVQPAVSSLSAIFDCLPPLCIHMIVDFLNNEDLKNCIDCYPGLDD